MIFLAALLAGMLTVLAPCVVSVIPILLARTTSSATRRSPFLVIAGLGVSILLFSVLLKSSTLLFNVPSVAWSIISGSIVTLFGLSMVFPTLWEQVMIRTRLVFIAQSSMSKASTRKGLWGDLLLGASLGPVFSACSPTYALIVASILPVEPLLGLGYLTAFIVGLAIMLGAVALFGQALIKRLGWGINPSGIFRRVVGMLLIVIGIMMIFGLDKDLLTLLVQNGWFDWQINLETGLM
jgi:cytochrome c biogenesis protein CcdA